MLFFTKVRCCVVTSLFAIFFSSHALSNCAEYFNAVGDAETQDTQLFRDFPGTYTSMMACTAICDDTDNRPMCLLLSCGTMCLTVGLENCSDFADRRAKLDRYKERIEILNDGCTSDAKTTTATQNTQSIPDSLVESESTTKSTTQTLIKSASIMGPQFSSDYPNGIYKLNNISTKLIYSAFSSVSKGNGLLSVSEATELAESADSRLHETTSSRRYIPMARDTLVILKYASTYFETIEIVGTGMIIRKENDQHVVIENVEPGSPAASATIAANDFLVKINGIDTSNMVLDDVVKLLRGEIGTSVSLELLRGTTRLTKDIVRSTIPYEEQRNDDGYLAIFRTKKDGGYYYFEKHENSWKPLPISVIVNPTWSVGDVEISIELLRPKPVNNQEDDGRIEYSFSLSSA